MLFEVVTMDLNYMTDRQERFEISKLEQRHVKCQKKKCKNLVCICLLTFTP